jgi:hypothetical protein
MTLQEIVERMHLSVRTGQDRLDRAVTGAYAGDVLSDVIANGKADSVWITMQTHANVVAVAVLKDLAGIVIVQGREPSADTLEKATKEKVAIMVSELGTFETVGKLSEVLNGEP